MKCNVPLIVNFGKTKLKIWSNGKVNILPLPFNPFIIKKDEKGDLIVNSYTEKNVRVRKIQYNNILDFKEVYKYLPESESKDLFYTSLKIMYYTFAKDLIMKYKQTDDLKILILDIEAITDSKLTTSGENPITSIAAKFNDNDIICFSDFRKTLKYPDLYIIKEFTSYFQQVDPDIIVSYTPFDIIVLQNRINKMKGTVDVLAYHREFGHSSRATVDEYKFASKKPDGTYYISFNGRIYIDLYQLVKKDTSLTGITDRKLKTLAKFYNLDYIELTKDQMNDMINIVNTPILTEYNKSDVNITSYIFYRNYINSLISLAEQLEIALEDSYDFLLRKSNIAELLLFREMSSKNIYPFGTNAQRYPDIVKDVNINGKIEKRFKYEGAYVDICKTGVISPVWKYDFSSFYPSAALTFNISPETTTIYAKNQYTGQFKFWRQEGYLYISCPDSNLNLDVVIRIALPKEGQEGIVRKMIQEMWKKKDEIKKQLKKDPNNLSLQSQYNNIKVIINAFSYGASGLAYSRCGDLASAFAISSICRYISKRIVTDVFKEHTVEVDTDGIYVDKKFDLNVLQQWINDLIKNEFHLKSYFKIDEEEYQSSFFYKMKNYILKTYDNKTIIHGAAFKSSSKCKLFAHVLHNMIDYILNNPKTTLKDMINYKLKLSDLSQYKWPDDFVLSFRVSRDKDEYISKTSLSYKMIEQYEQKTETRVRTDDTIFYVVTKGMNYKILDNLSPNDIYSEQYYRELIDNFCEEVFGIPINNSVSLFHGMLKEEKKEITEEENVEEDEI